MTSCFHDKTEHKVCIFDYLEMMMLFIAKKKQEKSLSFKDFNLLPTVMFQCFMMIVFWLFLVKSLLLFVCSLSCVKEGIGNACHLCEKDVFTRKFEQMIRLPSE